MKKIRYLIFGLVFACLGLTSFSSAGSITYTGSIDISIASSTTSKNIFYLPVPNSLRFGNDYSNDLSSQISSISCTISNLVNTPGIEFTDKVQFSFQYLTHTQSLLYSFADTSNHFGNGTFLYSFTNPTSKYGILSQFYLVAYYNRPGSSGNISFDYECVMSGPTILSSVGNDCPTCEVCQDCSSIQNAYETLSGYYATCQSNLSLCEGSLSGYDSCQGSLGACLEDNISLENMNESLSSQLEACLLNGGNGCDPEVDTGCITGAFQVPLLSWSVGLDSFTTPIINNLTLPTNYKGKIVDGVLTISSVNNNLSISDSDMDQIKDSIVEVSQYIFRLALILMIIYYIKFYIFNSKK